MMAPMRNTVKIFVIGLLLVATTPLPADFPPYVPQNPIRDVTGKKKGFFHVEKQADGRWWVIDPAGYGFVPIGVDQCRLEHHPGYKELMLAKHGTVEGWETETIARLKDWGFTLFGGACSHRLFHKGIAHTIYPWVGEPYSFDGGEKAILKGTGHPGTAFPNVFDPGFEEYCRRCTKRVFAPQKNDPWLFGWFFDNELAWWGNQHEMMDCYGLVDAIAALPPEHSARKAHDDFFAAHRGEWPAAKIRREFMRLVAERYFGIITSAIREADPNHMILGCRFAGVGDASVAPEVWEAAGRHLDIVSFNNYPWADLERRRVLVSESATQTVIDRYEEIYRLTGRPFHVQRELQLRAGGCGRKSIRGPDGHVPAAPRGGRILAPGRRPFRECRSGFLHAAVRSGICAPPPDTRGPAGILLFSRRRAGRADRGNRIAQRLHRFGRRDGARRRTGNNTYGPDLRHLRALLVLQDGREVRLHRADTHIQQYPLSCSGHIRARDRLDRSNAGYCQQSAGVNGCVRIW